MTEVSRLQKHKRRQKSRKPEFKRYEAHKKLKLRNKSWRRPRGIHSKMRKMIAGRKRVRVGYGSPEKVRHLHPSGYKEVLVHNSKELESIEKESQAARIASKVGVRKRLDIEEKANEMGIKILNKGAEG